MKASEIENTLNRCLKKGTPAEDVMKYFQEQRVPHQEAYYLSQLEAWIDQGALLTRRRVLILARLDEDRRLIKFEVSIQRDFL
jgi:hypothetical protein